MNKLLETLQAKKNGAALSVVPSPPSAALTAQMTPAAPTAPTAAAPQATPQAAFGNKLLARLQLQGAPAASSPVPAAINPPEWQPPPAAAAPAAGVAPTALVAGPPLVATHTAAPGPAGASVIVGAVGGGGAPTTGVVAEAEKRGRGRPKKAVVPATDLAVKIETLYLDCGPVGVPVVDANQFILLAKKKIAATGLADYRFAEYGAGPGMLAVAAAAELDALEGTLSSVRLDTTTPEGSIITVEFAARAAMVVR